MEEVLHRGMEVGEEVKDMVHGGEGLTKGKRSAWKKREM